MLGPRFIPVMNQRCKVLEINVNSQTSCFENEMLTLCRPNNAKASCEPVPILYSRLVDLLLPAWHHCQVLAILASSSLSQEQQCLGGFIACEVQYTLIPFRKICIHLSIVVAEELGYQ